MILLMSLEFGCRVRDNGSGAGGVAFVLGEKVKGSHYGQMPWLKPEHLVQGDLDPNMDFRNVYSTIPDKISREPSGSVSLSFFKRSIVEHQR